MVKATTKHETTLDGLRNAWVTALEWTAYGIYDPIAEGRTSNDWHLRHKAVGTTFCGAVIRPSGYRGYIPTTSLQDVAQMQDTMLVPVAPDRIVDWQKYLCDECQSKFLEILEVGWCATYLPQQERS